MLTALLGVPVAAAVLPLEGSGARPRPKNAPRTTVAPTTTGVPTTTEAPTTTVAPTPPRRISIAEENRRPGTAAWAVPQDPRAWDRVRGYASRTSVAPGEAFSLHVSTAAPHYEVTAYRMGHYGGAGGREVWHSGRLPGWKQAPATTDPVTNMRRAPWKASLGVHPDDDWVPGSYLLKLTSSDGGQSQVPLVIRDDDRPAPVHIQHDVTTWQAYNQWGGASLYEGDKGRSTKVTFDRPYSLSGSGNFLGGVHEISQLVESLGYEVTYSTSLDTHAHPERVRDHQVWISPAHDEYWSPEMRDGVEKARDHGVNLMFLGANCMFRRIRLEPSPIGPNRVQVNYRDPALDPLNGVDPARVTASWRDQPDPRPESSIIGTFYESNPVAADMVIVDPGAWMFEGTGVRYGEHWPNFVGNEYDRVNLNVPTPANIQVLAHSAVVCRGHHSFADMAYYTTASGAGVFSGGSIWLERHFLPGSSGPDGQATRMMTNLLRVFAHGPAGRTHPSRSNLAALGITKDYVDTSWAAG